MFSVTCAFSYLVSSQSHSLTQILFLPSGPPRITTRPPSPQFTSHLAHRCRGSPSSSISMATRTYSNFSWASSSSRLSTSLSSSSPYVSSFGTYSYSSSSVLHTSSHHYQHPHLPQQPQVQPQQHHRRVERVSTPVQHVYSLHEAATYANENAVALALHGGADVNACDESGRTALTCVIGGERCGELFFPSSYQSGCSSFGLDHHRWEDADASDASYLLEKRLNIIKMLLEHSEISLQVLNAPQGVIRGATPLGLAAWLDIPEAVRILLEHCPGMVAVDGMDAFGATALMCKYYPYP